MKNTNYVSARTQVELNLSVEPKWYIKVSDKHKVDPYLLSIDEETITYNLANLGKTWTAKEKLITITYTEVIHRIQTYCAYRSKKNFRY